MEGRITFGALLGVIVLGCGAGRAHDLGLAVSEERLEEARGGLDLPTDLRASLALERAAYVNGDLVAQRRVTIPDIGEITAGEARALADATRALVIQNGPDNEFLQGRLDSTATVIQNTLNDQHLATLTSLKVEVNSLGMFREQAFQDGLTRAIGSVGVVR